MISIKRKVNCELNCEHYNTPAFKISNLIRETIHTYSINSLSCTWISWRNLSKFLPGQSFTTYVHIFSEQFVDILDIIRELFEILFVRKQLEYTWIVVLLRIVKFHDHQSYWWFYIVSAIIEICAFFFWLFCYYDKSSK